MIRARGSPPLFVIGTRLADRYELLAELGRGGMGVVYRAKDPLLNRDVAVKLIPPGNLTRDAEERFQREAQIVAQMDHPAIVPIYDFGRHEGSLFFVMPLLLGNNLRHLLREGSLRLGDVLDVGTQVADALDYSHARAIVHRDIKPENVMTAREDGGHVRARVADFGLALTSTENRLTKTGTLVGTVAYFSPEQVTSAHALDGRTDIYALGTVLYECLAGDPPFAGEVQAVLYRIVHELPQPLGSLGADVSEELQEIIFQCLAKDPEKRPRRAGLVAEALRRYRGKLHENEYSRSVVLTASRLVARPAATTPFIGREKEMAELQRRLHAAVAGECEFVVVAGEPGIGKSRLADELKSLARARKLRVLQGRFVEHDRAFAHQGFCELIQDYFRGKDPGASATSRPDFSDLASDLLSLFPVLSEIGELRTAAGADSGATRPGETKKVEDRIAIFELLARTLTRLAGGKPLLLVLEELHGAQQSIEALQYVVRRLAPTPTLILGTYRTTEVDKRHPLLKMLESFRGDPRFASLTLGPLSPSEHRALVEVATGGGKPSEDLAGRLLAATEGNPLFTKELVRSLMDSGGIALDPSGALSLSAASISSDALPETIQQAVEARIERLPQELREIVSVASVLGRSFEFRDLEALLEGAKGLDDAVDRLVRDGILEEEREGRGDRLAFASGIVRDVLYGTLSRRRRRSLHRVAAVLLEKRHAGRLERVYPDLLHHFSEGDIPEKAVEYGLKLARKSLDAFSPEEAIRVAKITLDYLEDEEWSGDESLEGDARLVLAQASRMAGHSETALREAEAAVKVFEAGHQPARAVEGLLAAAEIAWHARRVDEARRWVERGIETAFAAHDDAHLPRLLSLAATVANLRADYQRGAAYAAQLERLTAREKVKTEEVATGGRLVVALANPVAAAEPAARLLVEETEFLATVFETLLATDADGQLVPSLCEEWSLGDDGRAARLRLRRDVRFSDGSPLTAEAVKSSLERAIRKRPDGIPAALAAVHGAREHRAGAADSVSGIRVSSEGGLEFEFLEPIPIFPALLTDVLTAIVRAVPGADHEERFFGTGPFVVSERSAERIVVERNPRHWKGATRLEAIEFRTGMTASAIAAGLRSGEIEIARDLSPHDLDAILREPRLRAGLVETPKKGTYFVLFNSSSPMGGNPALRRALAGVTRSQDFVWAALGRFAVPATGLLPPGILGHDAGRRRPLLPRDQALALLEGAGLAGDIRLTAAVHPILQDRHHALTAALLAIWKELGVEVSIVTSTMKSYLEAQARGSADLLIGRWMADYEDPDDFTFVLFHSASGHMRSFFSSAETDRIAEEARTESRPGVREALYRRFENHLLEGPALVPLFHEVDYRIAGPLVRGLQLRSSPPFINYAELGKAATAPAAEAPHEWEGGILQVPIAGVVDSIDPASMAVLEQAETIPLVFETLTRDPQGGRVVPWLASEVLPEEGGRRFRFRLRPAVRFHDGRALTVRDVRYSFERLLQKGTSSGRFLLAPIRGAQRLLDGTAADLEGFHVVSASEFVLELEKPVSFFPVLVSYPGTGIVPEGTTTVGESWRKGAVGTGPYRVVSFETGKRLELERNPGYWRGGYPKNEGIVFRCGVPPEEIQADFLAGRLSIASDLLPAGAEALRQDPRFRTNYRESPSLVTYFVAFNGKRGPFADVRTRRVLAEGIDTAAIVRSTLGRHAIPANGVIPPGLLGSVVNPRSRPRTPAQASGAHTISRETIEVTAVANPIMLGEFGALTRELLQGFREMGFAVRIVNKTIAEFLEAQKTAPTDLAIGRWIADYPDADTFVQGVLHSREGVLGRYCATPEIDALAERGRAEIDPRVRDSVYRQVENIVARDALLLPLFHEQVYRFARPEVEELTVGFGQPVVLYENLRIRA